MAGIRGALERAARWLPHQGPLSVFVHHNTLAELEGSSFDDALDEAAAVTGACVRLGESEYRAFLDHGGIEERDLRAVFESDTQAMAPDGTGRLDLPLSDALPPARELAWRLLREGQHATHWRIRAFCVAEGAEDPLVAKLSPRARATLGQGARRLFSRDVGAALAVITGAEGPTAARRLREQHGLEGPRHALATCMDDARRAAELGFALLSGLARRGLPARARARWTPNPDLEALHRAIDEVLLPVVAATLDRGQADFAPASEAGLFAAGAALLDRRARGGLRADAEGSLEALLREVGCPPERWEEALRAVLLARPGWASAVRWSEHHHGRPRLADYAALRLALLAARAADPLAALFPPPPPLLGPGSRADRVAQLLAVAEVGPDRAEALAERDWAQLETLAVRCGPDWRARLLQEARERTAARAWLSALHARAALGPRAAAAPALQVLCCIDEREESLRRALEEVGGSAVATYGLAGHFNLPLRWRGVDDLHGSARHPVTLRSTHRVEEVAQGPAPWMRRWVGRLIVALDRPGLLAGAVAAVAGVPALLFAAWRVLAPRRSESILDGWRARALPPPAARLVARDDGERGFPVADAADRVGGALRLIGLTSGFAPVVAVLGHGSTSQNNPHEAAHDCGACGGFRGDGNARAFAALANDPDVRRALAARGVVIPDGTRFVAGYHDTASDHVRLDPGGEGQRPLFDAACARDALERGRRFLALPLGGEPMAALRHAEGRSADLSEVRPEYGHATNALFVVGPRAQTRGLFLDRRAFLHSYEPDADPDGATLEAILAAAVPVCAGINLEYYFSRVDNARFGAGTKLPHNVVGLHGVMNGSLGDLRTGLPWQMVEIHEPTRLLVVVLAPRKRVVEVMERVKAVRDLVLRRWIHLAVIDEDGAWTWDGALSPADLGDSRLPTAPDSLGLARGRRDPIGPVLVGS